VGVRPFGSASSENNTDLYIKMLVSV